MDENSPHLLHPIVAGVSLGLVCLLTLPALAQLRSKSKLFRTGYDAVPELFESEDGQATEESVAAFSDRGARIAAWVSLAIGLAASTASAILLTLSRDVSVTIEPAALHVLNNWADVPAWVSTETSLSRP